MEVSKYGHILEISPKLFLEKYLGNIIIIDATFKCQLGVNTKVTKGGIRFISQIYEGSISGFLEVLRQKLITKEIKKKKKGDAIMADKGFDTLNDFKRLGLHPKVGFKKDDKVGFEEDDVIKTQTIA